MLPFIVEGSGVVGDVTSVAVGGLPAATSDTVISVDRFVVEKNPATTHLQTIEYSVDSGMSWQSGNIVGLTGTVCENVGTVVFQVRQRDLIGNFAPVDTFVALQDVSSVCPP